jgi:hypothetical protein
MKGPVIMKLALSNVPPEKIGAGSGLLTMMRDFGTPAGVSIGLAIFSSTRQSTTLSSLEDQATSLGINNPETLGALKTAFTNSSAADLPALQTALATHNTSFEQLLSVAKLDGLASTLPAVGGILIAVVSLALMLALSLSKPVKRPAA